MVRLLAAVAVLSSVALTVEAQPLPRCGPALDGQVTPGGCECGHSGGGALDRRAAGWRWTCDVLRGPGAILPVVPAGEPAPGLPPGFTVQGMPSAGVMGSGGRAMGY